MLARPLIAVRAVPDAARVIRGSRRTDCSPASRRAQDLSTPVATLDTTGPEPSPTTEPARAVELADRGRCQLIEGTANVPANLRETTAALMGHALRQRESGNPSLGPSLGGRDQLGSERLSLSRPCGISSESRTPQKRASGVALSGGTVQAAGSKNGGRDVSTNTAEGRIHP
jgi:hypothetical protein